MKNFCEENNVKEKLLTPDAQKKLLGYSFPGNVRELKSVIELAIVMSSDNKIDAQDITLTSSDIITEVTNEELTMQECDLRILTIYLKKYNDNIKLVAEKLNISQSTIYRMLKKP